MDSSRPVLWLSGCRTNNIPLREPKSSPPGSSKPLRGLNGISTGRFKPGSSLSTFHILIICTFLVLLVRCRTPLFVFGMSWTVVDKWVQYDFVTIGSPGDGIALKGWQTWAQPLGWPLSHWVCWVVSKMVQGYHSQYSS